MSVVCHSHAVTPPKPMRRNGEKHWDSTPNTSKYVRSPPCRSVQTERSCRCLLVIRRYPFRLKCLNSVVFQLSKTKSLCIAYFYRRLEAHLHYPVLSVGDVLTMITDTEILPVTEVRSIYIAASSDLLFSGELNRLLPTKVLLRAHGFRIT